MSEFQERLWSQLVSDHAASLAYPIGTRYPLPALPIVEPRRRPRLALPALRPRRIAAGLTALAMVLAVAMLLATSGTAPSAAYAVMRNPDGSIGVSIAELTGVAGANAQLARLGASVAVVPVLADCPSSGTPTPIPPSLAGRIAHIEGQGVTVQPGLVPAGDTLVLGARELSGFVGLGYRLYRGAAPPCLPTGDSDVG